MQRMLKQELCCICHGDLAEWRKVTCSNECHYQYKYMMEIHPQETVRRNFRRSLQEEPWQEVERGFKRKRDKEMPISLPRLKFMEGGA